MEFHLKETDDQVPVYVLTIFPDGQGAVTFTFLELEDALQEIHEWKYAGDNNAEQN
jgi:hypothetical protein